MAKNAAPGSEVELAGPRGCEGTGVYSQETCDCLNDAKMVGIRMLLLSFIL